MAWGLEARVPFLDKAFLEVAMNIRPEDKTFSKGEMEEKDEDGKPRMEKVGLDCPVLRGAVLNTASTTVHSAQSFRLCTRRSPILTG